MTSRYFPQYKADVFKKNFRVRFQRLFKDLLDTMNDSPQKNWTPADDFIITLEKLESVQKSTSYESFGQHYEVESSRDSVVQSVIVHVSNKNTANRIWVHAKKFSDYENLMLAVQQEVFLSGGFIQ